MGGIEAWHASPEVHELHCMGWDALGQLAERGWEIGSHTRTHPHLRRLSDDALLAELPGVRANRSPVMPCRGSPIAAHPDGEVDARTARTAEDAGRRRLLSSHSLARALPVLWPRVGVRRRLRLIGSGLKHPPFTRSCAR